MLEIPKLIEPVFREAGWKGPKSQAPLGRPPASAYAIANQIVDEFGGLTVGTCGLGTEMASSDVRFYECPRCGLFQAWAEQIGEVVAFASAHHDHMILSVGTDGTFYVFTDPDGQLYQGPQNFGELMRRLLWGFSYGSTMSKDAYQF
ncbi:SUKH-3 domain-containing protein [Janthinobacterium sp. 75]|uniref:SUKH-3 domain-containing protein n=1 Tax=unclassified Janthinobacterium TaxID=2610881 RepID=UPI001063781B|nr:SUKH-3 domain-containing protein [Janthinobacterium sp. 75]